VARRATGKQIRVRSKRLDQLDETKLALALWLMAKDMLPPKPEQDAATEDAQGDSDELEAR
jgi:hypothetical protein